jgi:chromosomal replication initiation ATPase DnaA
MQVLLADVERLLGVPVDEVLGRSQQPRIALARKAVYWVLRGQRYSYPEIAQATERLDHTTVIHGVRSFEKRIGVDPELRAIAEQLAGPVSTARRVRVAEVA